jgi:hypothetical protein
MKIQNKKLPQAITLSLEDERKYGEIRHVHVHSGMFHTETK